MTSEQHQQRPHDRAYVWVWLPDSTSPVVAGVVAPTGEALQGEPVVAFRYAQSYLERDDAISLWTPELPLEDAAFDPRRPRRGRDPMALASCLRDAAPDAWGRRVIDLRLAGHPSGTADHLIYLLGAGSNRIGALDFQTRPDTYIPRDDDATLEQLVDMAALVESGQRIPDSLAAAAQHGTSIGGARPKALLTDGSRQLIAKFSSSSDDWPAVKAEALAMLLAARAGIRVAPVEIQRVGGKDVLLVERFDRRPRAHGAPERRGMLSMLAILGLNARGSWGATYADIAQEIRTGPWSDVPGTLREMFTRLVFNILIGNNDDHLRNHAAFWDGHTLTRTPAYDLAPQVRHTNTSSQAIGVTRDGQRASQLRLARQAAPEFHLTAAEADDIIDALRTTITAEWDACADLAQLTGSERAGLLGRQFLNPYIDYPEA